MLVANDPDGRVIMRNLTFLIVVCLSLSLVAGCSGPININTGDVLARLTDAVGPIQTQPQTLPPVLVQEGDTILIDNSVTIIDNPAQDIVVVELPNQTVLGFENDTGWDIYIQYFADGELQGVYVYDGEALLLEYPCLNVIELSSEDDVDPDTGLLVDSFDLTGADFFNPGDFACGDAFILNFDPSSVNARTEVVDLLP
jgi:hypothetical protein